MKTLIVIEVDHKKDIPHLADMIAGRAYTISGVTNAEVVKDWEKRGALSYDELRAMGFSLEEISLGAGEVVR
jgi:hypothetical protein